MIHPNGKNRDLFVRIQVIDNLKIKPDKVRINQNTIFTKTELHFTNNTNQFLNLRFSFSKIILISVNKMVIYMFPSGPGL